MHKERLLAVAKAVREGNPEDFNMGAYTNTCGTPACCFGHCCARRDLQLDFSLKDGFPHHVDSDLDMSHVNARVAKHFGLKPSETDFLFSSADDKEGGVATYCGNDNEHAAQLIERFVREGGIFDPSIPEVTR